MCSLKKDEKNQNLGTITQRRGQKQAKLQKSSNNFVQDKTAKQNDIKQKSKY